MGIEPIPYDRDPDEECDEKGRKRKKIKTLEEAKFSGRRKIKDEDLHMPLDPNYHKKPEFMKSKS